MRNRLLISEQERSEILSMYHMINEEQTTSIKGFVKTLPMIDSFEQKSRGVNLKIDLYGDSNLENDEILGDDDDLINLNLIDSTVTNNSSEFYFKDLKDLSNIVVRFEGNDFFEPSEEKINNLVPNKENNITLVVNSKIEKPISIKKDIDYTNEKIQYCEKKESNDNNFFGLGFYEEKTFLKPESILKYDEKKLLYEANKIGMKDAFEEYLTKYPSNNSNVSVNKMLDIMISENIIDFKKPKYRVICKKILTEKGNFVASTVVKFKKNDLDSLVNYIILKSQPKITPLEFDNYDFQKALELSYDLKRKIFLFVCSDTNTECSNLLQEFLNLKSIKEKLKFYITLYYQVNRSETKKFVLASESLKIDTYPTMLILEASKDPRKNTIKDSVKLIKKITEFSDLEEKINNLLS